MNAVARSGWLRGLLLSRDFSLLWTASAISTLGDVVYQTTLILWLATDLAAGRWAPLAVGGLVVIESVVAIVGGPLAGVYVDRWRKRALMVRMDLVRCAIVAALLAAQLAGRGRLSGMGMVAVVYAMVLLESVCSRFAQPAEIVMISELVTAQQRPRAMALERSASSAAVLIGPSLAAPLLFAAGVQWGLALNAASFAVAAVLRRRISNPGEVRRVEGEERSGLRADLLEGLRHARSNPVLRTVIVSISAFSLAGGAVNALMVFFVTANLHAPARYFGVMGTAAAIGVLAGSVLAPAAVRALGAGRAFWLVGAADGVVLLAMSRLSSFPPALALTVVFGLGEAVAVVVLMPLLMDAVDHRLLGRANALLGTAESAARTLSIFVSGLLASTVLAHLDANLGGTHFRTYDSIFGVAALMVLATALWARGHLAVSEPVPAVASA